MTHRSKLLSLALVGLALAALSTLEPPAAAGTRLDDRVTPDNRAGSYARLDGTTDSAHAFCATNRRQQAEPAVAVNPRNPRVIVAGAADQCYGNQRAFPIGNAQGWLALYRSTDAGRSWKASLLPGYPGDMSVGLPPTNCGQADATLAFDNDGRLFYGALCPDQKADQVGPLDFHIVVSTFDRDGSRYTGAAGVDADAEGLPDATTAADKPNIAVDLTRGPNAGNVYVAYTTCPRIVLDKGPDSIAPCAGGEGRVAVARSTDHGQSFSTPVTIGSRPGKPSYADVAVDPQGNVYVTATTMEPDGSSSDVLLSRSTDAGVTFSAFAVVARVTPFNSAQSAGTGMSPAASEHNQGASLPCGDGAFACESGFTFSPIRTLSAVAADSRGVHVVWSARLPSGQAKVFVRSSADGLRWPRPASAIDTQRRGHQWYPDIASAGGVTHIVFYDSRADRAYSPRLPPGNTATGKSSGPSVDTYAARSRDGGRTWTEQRLSTASQQPGLDAQLGARAPWVGDYLYVSAVPGGSYAVWTDARDVVPGADARGGPADGFDVYAPCTWLPATEDLPQAYPFVSPTTGDPCLSQGGLDLNIYGSRLSR